MPKKEARLLVELSLPWAGMECAAVRCYDAVGQLLEVPISRVEIEPLFARSDAMPVLAYARVSAVTGQTQKELHRQLIVVSGSTGELRLRNLVEVAPRCLEADAEAAHQGSGVRQSATEQPAD